MTLPTLHIDVICAWPDRVWLRRIELPAGSTVEDALAASRAPIELSELGDPPVVGVFGRAVSQGHVLVDGDRVELYRPLQADPKDARRRRAATQRKT